MMKERKGRVEERDMERNEKGNRRERERKGLSDKERERLRKKVTKKERRD